MCSDLKTFHTHLILLSALSRQAERIMGNIQSYEKDFVIGTTVSAQSIANKLNQEADRKRMEQAWNDVQRSLGEEYGVVGNIRDEQAEEDRRNRHEWLHILDTTWSDLLTCIYREPRGRTTVSEGYSRSIRTPTARSRTGRGGYVQDGSSEVDNFR